ncbi:hypothetical protein, partial [Rhizobium skierniewicense]
CVVNLAHSASFHSLENIAPSNAGIKQFQTSEIGLTGGSFLFTAVARHDEHRESKHLSPPPAGQNAVINHVRKAALGAEKRKRFVENVRFMLKNPR